MIGEELRKKREEKELSFDNIYEETGILREHLEALENDEFLHFPNKVYARSFLRDYANYLCMDTYNLLREFEEVYTKLLEENKPEPVEIIEPVELPTGQSFMSKTTGIFIVFIILCVLAFFVGKFSNNKNVPVQEENTKNTMVPITEKPDEKTLKTEQTVMEKKVEEPDKVAEALKAGEKEAAEKIAIAKEFNVVTVYAHRNLWVKIKVDNKPVYEGTIKGGANLEFKVKNNIQLRGGEPSACQINVDGKSIGKLGQPGKPFDLTLTPKTMAIVKQ